MTAGTLLSGQVTAGGLGLAASGSWTAEHARTLEPLIEHATRTDATVQRIIIDVTRIERLDTYGAWLIERTLRVWTGRGCDTRIVGLSDSYGNLFKKVRAGAGKLTPLPRRSNSITATLESVGRTMSAVFADILLFSQMAGALVVAFLRVVAHPTKFRFTSMVNHLERVGWHAVPIIILITVVSG